MKSILYSILGVCVFITTFWLSFTSGIRDDAAAMERLKHGHGFIQMSDVLNDIKQIKMNSEVIANEIKKAEKEDPYFGDLSGSIPGALWISDPDSY